MFDILSHALSFLNQQFLESPSSSSSSSASSSSGPSELRAPLEIRITSWVDQALENIRLFAQKLKDSSQTPERYAIIINDSKSWEFICSKLAEIRYSDPVWVHDWLSLIWEIQTTDLSWQANFKQLILLKKIQDASQTPSDYIEKIVNLENELEESKNNFERALETAHIKASEQLKEAKYQRPLYQEQLNLIYTFLETKGLSYEFAGRKSSSDDVSSHLSGTTPAIVLLQHDGHSWLFRVRKLDPLSSGVPKERLDLVDQMIKILVRQLDASIPLSCGASSSSFLSPASSMIALRRI